MAQVELRNDDVLQVKPATAHQRQECEGRDMFELFLEADQWFEKYQYSSTLTLLAEGIDHYPEWVEHIKKNLHRYKLELHGLRHDHYNRLPQEQGYADLKEAKEKIESAFGVKLTTWYVPYGHSYRIPWGKEVSEKLGLVFNPVVGKHDVKRWLASYQQGTPFPHTNFHFWHKGQRENVREILWLLNNEKT